MRSTALTPQPKEVLGRERRMSRFVLIAAIGCSSTAWAVACDELPVLFVVQDKSGSMTFAPDGEVATTVNPSKWGSAQSVVPALASRFTNRFRFGAMMYPAETSPFNCTTGVVTTRVSDDPSAIARAYDAGVGGGTPTAASLAAAKTYLLSLNLTTPAYVLLMTDGLPNCNLTLNVNTCSFTTPTCPQNSCDLGAKDCLDDRATSRAAAELYAANIPVFVVGFDSTLTTGNNLLVLDAIAAAGGTRRAYTATNQRQLSTALNQIALDTATCCKDACTAGESKCADEGAAEVQTCQFDAKLGCTVWLSTSCGSPKTCQNGQCTSGCKDTCAAGAHQCTSQGAQACIKSSNGCASWAATTSCGDCVEGACQASACTNSCDEGAHRCGATGPQECVRGSPCSGWRNLPACDPGSLCAEGLCHLACTGPTDNCPLGLTCVTASTSKICVPNQEVDAGVGGRAFRGDTLGCGCQATDSKLLFLGLPLAMCWVRRRKAF